MYAQRPAAAVEKYLEITAGLGGFDHAEGVFLTRNRQIESVISRDLQENAIICSTLICLACGVKETRAEPETGCDLVTIERRSAKVVEQSLGLGIHFHIGEQAEIVTCLDVIEV